MANLDDMTLAQLIELLAEATGTDPSAWSADGDGDPYYPEDDGPGWAYWQSGQVLRWCHGVLVIECDVMQNDLGLTARLLKASAQGWSDHYDREVCGE